MPPRANPVRRGRLNEPVRDTETQQPPPQPQPAPPPIEHISVGVAPTMISSLPPIASGADVYARQFYRGSRVPYRRYLPIVMQ